MKFSPLLIASHNAGKIREFQELLAPLGIEVISAANLNLEEPEETGTTFEENALLKAHAAAKASGRAALADDSGLAVDALDGAPGIYSARWAGPEKNFSVAMERIRTEIAAKKLDPQGAKAKFVCVLALALPDGYSRCFTGMIEGHLTFPPQGSQGFGYDPIFIPHGMNLTFAEMDAAGKHRLSHRARALEQFVSYLKENGEHV